MPGSILIALDGSDYCKKAIELGVRWAKKSKATLIGLAVVDEPGIIHGELVPIGASAFKEHRDKKLLEDAQAKVTEFRADFENRCNQAGVAHESRTISGAPWQQITQAAQEFDMVLLGSKTFLHFATQDEPCDSLDEIVKNAPRPVVAVPQTIPETDVTIIAFDGSMQAARALQVFVAVGLNHIHQVHVVSVDSDRETANSHAAKAANFLRYHNIDVTAHPMESRDKPSEVLLEHMDKLGAGLLVMGAYGQTFLREFFFGSATRRLLEHATIPVFLYH